MRPRGYWGLPAFASLSMAGSDGSLRPIQLQNIEDKIVQSATAEILNSIYESDFAAFSYGFRPGKSQHQALQALQQACLRPRDRFWDIPVPKIDSAFDNLFVPQPSWSPSTTQQLRKLVAAPYLPPNDWTPRSGAYFVFPLAQGTPGKQCGLAATGVYQPSLRSPWLSAEA